MATGGIDNSLIKVTDDGDDVERYDLGEIDTRLKHPFMMIFAFGKKWMQDSKLSLITEVRYTLIPKSEPVVDIHSRNDLPQTATQFLQLNVGFSFQL